jgi:hypothetical protein
MLSQRRRYEKTTQFVKNTIVCLLFFAVHSWLRHLRKKYHQMSISRLHYLSKTLFFYVTFVIYYYVYYDAYLRLRHLDIVTIVFFNSYSNLSHEVRLIQKFCRFLLNLRLENVT